MTDIVIGDMNYAITIVLNSDLKTFVGGDGATDFAGNVQGNAPPFLDSIVTGAGNDSVGGGSQISTGAGNDQISNGEYIDAGSGNDTVIMADITKEVLLGDGNDTINLIGNTDAYIDGGNGVDTINIRGDYVDLSRFDSDRDIIFSEDGTQIFHALNFEAIGTVSVSSYLYLGADYTNDAHIGAFTGATVIAGSGDDTINVSTDGSGTTVYGMDGDDTIDGAETAYGGEGNDIIRNAKTADGGNGDDSFYQVDNAVGGAGNDAFSLTLIGYGGDGDDYFTNVDNAYGDAGNDIFYGLRDEYASYGGTGDDLYVVGLSGENTTIVEYADEGIDTVQSSVTRRFTLSDNVENLYSAALRNIGNDSDNIIVYTGTNSNEGTLIDGGGGNDALTGGARMDTLIGGDGNDVLDGLGGADVLNGGAGDDIYYIDDAGDRALEKANQGIDTVYSSVAYRLRNNFEGLVLLDGATYAAGNDGDNTIIGSQAGDRLYGGDGDDLIRGRGGDDVLDGGADSDTLYGGAGDDTAFIRDAGDVFIEEADNGHDTVKSYVDYTLGANVEDLTLFGTAIAGTGNELDNALRGNRFGNVLNGGAGDDDLRGLDGNDSLNGGVGRDLLVGGKGADILTGGDGDDRFFFYDGDLTASGARERVTDFSQTQGDRIVLKSIDADTTTGGDQAFAFIGTAAFSGHAGDLRYELVGGATQIYGDTNGDGVADFRLMLDGTITLVGGDFSL